MDKAYPCIEEIVSDTLQANCSPPAPTLASYRVQCDLIAANCRAAFSPSLF